MNWRGIPLASLAVIVSLIASTHSRSGLRVRSEIDHRQIAGIAKLPPNASAPLAGEGCPP